MAYKCNQAMQKALEQELRRDVPHFYIIQREPAARRLSR